MYKFNPEKCYEEIINWTRDWFEKNGNDKKAIVGMSGGKDSTITAALLVKALGKERVIGVTLPDINQGLNDADKICEWLGIKCINFPIAGITTSFTAVDFFTLTDTPDFKWSEQSIQNIPPRIRMTVLYAIAQTYNGFVANCDNACEWYLGFFTKFGDGAGDFSLLHELTVEEELALADFIGIPKEWSHKTPDDGLPHSAPDEQKFGFTYRELSMYMRGLKIPCSETLEKIETWHNSTEHKRNIEIPCYKQTWYSPE